MANIYSTYNLTNQTPANTYANLVQINYPSSSFVDGDGNELDGVINVTSSYTVTASNAVTSSYALNISPADSASFAITASYALNISPADSASYALYAVAATSASFASQSISSSVVSITPTTNNQNYLLMFTANSGSQTPVIDGGFTSYYNPSNDTLTLLNLSSSLITASTGISGLLIGQHTGSTFGTASWSTNVVNIGSASWASSSLITISASFASQSIWATSSSFTSASLFNVSSSWASSSLFSSFGTSASFASSSNVSISASWASASITAIAATSASYASASSFNISSSWSSASLVTVSSSFTSASISSSFLSGPHTGSTFGTASWATNALTSNAATSASYASASLVTISASFASASISSSFLSGNATSSLFGTASWSKNATTASQGAFAWGSFVQVGGSNITASTYNCSISRTSIGLYPVAFVNNAATSNYAVIVNAASGSGVQSTSSLQCAVTGKATTGFSIYTTNISVVGALDTQALIDASTGSFVVFSY